MGKIMVKYLKEAARCSRRKGGKTMGYMDTYRFWLTDSYFDEATKAELKKIEQD